MSTGATKTVYRSLLRVLTQMTLIGNQSEDLPPMTEQEKGQVLSLLCLVANSVEDLHVRFSCVKTVNESLWDKDFVNDLETSEDTSESKKANSNTCTGKTEN